MGRSAVVFASVALPPTPRLRWRLSTLEAPYIVAADAGAETALRFGLTPDLVVGDFDSIGPDTLAELQQRGVVMEPFPRDKDDTDSDLAVERALAISPADLFLLGFLHGARLDHSLANVMLLTRAPSGTLLLDPCNECWLLRGGEAQRWEVERDEIVSLIPVGGDAVGVTTSGMRWVLQGATLRLGETRGVSNEPIAEQAGVALREGLLLVTRHFPPCV